MKIKFLDLEDGQTKIANVLPPKSAILVTGNHRYDTAVYNEYGYELKTISYEILARVSVQDFCQCYSLPMPKSHVHIPEVEGEQAFFVAEGQQTGIVGTINILGDPPRSVLTYNPKEYSIDWKNAEQYVPVPKNTTQSEDRG